MWNQRFGVGQAIGFCLGLRSRTASSVQVADVSLDDRWSDQIAFDFPVASDTNMGAVGEYAYVHFTLPYYEQISEGNIYIFGALTDWQFQKDAIMKYDPAYKAYVGTLYLKQGYYNYMYVLLRNNEKIGDETYIEGNHYDTENDYTIYVYNQEQGTTYDRLIAVKKLNSVRK